MRNSSPFAALVIASFFFACNGFIGDLVEAEPGVDEAAALDCSHANGAKPGPSPLRRLSREELRNTVADLLRVTDDLTIGFADERGLLGSQLVVDGVMASEYARVAATVAARIAANLADYVPCEPSGPGCGRAVVEQLGRRLFRRGLIAEEADRYTSALEATSAKEGFAAGVELVVEAMLQSPSFLYRVETGAGETGIVPVTGYAMASRLAFLLWRRAPEAELLDAAERGELDTPEQIVTRARAMLADPRAQGIFDAVHDDWLQLYQLETLQRPLELYPTYSPELRDAFRRETLDFVAHVRDSGASFGALFTSDTRIVDAKLAAFLGFDGVTSTTPTSITVSDRPNAGLLTQVGVLATHTPVDRTSPTLRGHFVRDRLFCSPLPPPPPGVDGTLPDTTGLTSRQRIEALTASNAECQACHGQMDPIGFTLESFDPVGRYATQYADGQAIDTSGILRNIDGADAPLADVEDLGRLMATSEQVAACYATQWLRFGGGRETTREDACNVEGIKSRLLAGASLDEAVIAYITSDAFLFRNANN